MAEFSETNSYNKPISVILLGQAGSGRTNVLAGVIERLHMKTKNSFAINLDPLIESEKFFNINIGESTPYNDIKNQYKFSHNKTLVTSLNLFSARIDQVTTILSEKESTFEYLFIDTPNPEVFLSSAAGVIFSQMLSSRYPTVLLYVLDSQKCEDPMMFLNAVLDACAVKIKLGLPIFVVCNKTDLIDWNVMKSWTEDSQSLMSAILKQEENIPNTIASSVYNFPSICQELKIINTSMRRNEGLDELIEAINESKIEYENTYEVAIAKRRNTRVVDVLRKQIDNLLPPPQNFLDIPIKESIQTKFMEMSKGTAVQSNVSKNDDDDDDDDERADAYMRENFFLFGNTSGDVSNKCAEDDGGDDDD